MHQTSRCIDSAHPCLPSRPAACDQQMVHPPGAHLPALASHPDIVSGWNQGRGAADLCKPGLPLEGPQVGVVPKGGPEAVGIQALGQRAAACGRPTWSGRAGSKVGDRRSPHPACLGAGCHQLTKDGWLGALQLLWHGAAQGVLLQPPRILYICHQPGLSHLHGRGAAAHKTTGMWVLHQVPLCQRHALRRYPWQRALRQHRRLPPSLPPPPWPATPSCPPTRATCRGTHTPGAGWCSWHVPGCADGEGKGWRWQEQQISGQAARVAAQRCAGRPHRAPRASPHEHGRVFFHPLPVRVPLCTGSKCSGEGGWDSAAAPGEAACRCAARQHAVPGCCRSSTCLPLLVSTP